MGIKLRPTRVGSKRNPAARNGATVLQLWVASDEVGKVIGGRGWIARALRTVARVSAARVERRVMLESVE